MVNYSTSQQIFKDEATDAGAAKDPDAMDCSQGSENRRKGKGLSSSSPTGRKETQSRAGGKGNAKGYAKGKGKGRDPLVTNR